MQLGARIHVVEASILNFNAYLLSLPDKKTMTAVVKCNKTSGLDRNIIKHDRACDKVLSFVVMGVSEDLFSCISRLCCV